MKKINNPEYKKALNQKRILSNMIKEWDKLFKKEKWIIPIVKEKIKKS